MQAQKIFLLKRFLHHQKHLMIMNIGYIVGRAIKHLHPRAIRESKIDRKARIGAASQVVGSNVEKYSYCGYGCIIINATIGRFCSIADNVLIGGANHALTHVSTSPIFHDGKNPFNKILLNAPPPRMKQTLIGNDVWIGHSAKINAGVIIGDGAVIGMGAVVSRDVPPYAIVGGVPARFIKNRFKPEIILKLIELRWWDWEEERIQSFSKLFDDPEAFIAACS